MPTLGYTPSLVSLALITAASQPPRRCYGKLATALQSFVEVGNSNSKSEVARGQLRKKGPPPLSLSLLMPHKRSWFTFTASRTLQVARQSSADRDRRGDGVRPTDRPTNRTAAPAAAAASVDDDDNVEDCNADLLNALDFGGEVAGGRAGTGGGSGRLPTRHEVKQPSSSAFAPRPPCNTLRSPARSRCTGTVGGRGRLARDTGSWLCPSGPSFRPSRTDRQTH